MTGVADNNLVGVGTPKHSLGVFRTPREGQVSASLAFWHMSVIETLDNLIWDLTDWKILGYLKNTIQKLSQLKQKTAEQK